MTKRKASEVRNAIKVVIASAGQLQTTIHELSLECMEHAMEHGDVTLADLIVKELPKGQRVEALKTWFETFSPIRWNGSGEVGQLKREARAFTPYDIEQASAKPYYELTKEKVQRELTLEQLVNIVNGLAKRIDKAEENGTIGAGENVNAMRTYVDNLNKVKLPANIAQATPTPAAEAEEDADIEYEEDNAPAHMPEDNDDTTDGDDAETTEDQAATEDNDENTAAA